MRVRTRKLMNTSTKSVVVCKFKVRMISKEFKFLDGDNKTSNRSGSMSLTVGDLKECKTIGIVKESSEFVTVKQLEENEIEDDETFEVLSQCEFCGKQYKNEKRLKDHLRFCHPKVYHKCIICSQQFPKKWLLNTHMRNHTDESPYSCSYCGQKFVSNSKLQMHSNYHHKQEELSCKICNTFGFYTKQDLGNHIRTKHTRERAFKCDVCDKSFMSSGVYYQHRFIHTDVKKYTCEICSKGFQRWLTLDKHLRIHRNEFPFSCDVCRQAFRQRGDVKKHKKSQHSNLKV